MIKRNGNIIIFAALLLYRIPLVHIIGDNGMGFLSGPIEAILCMSFLACSGFTKTMQGLMRDRIRRGQYRNAKQVFNLSTKYALILAVLMIVAFLPGYNFVSSGILVDGRQRLACIFVGPVIAINILSALNKGYLGGTDNTMPLFVGQVAQAVLDGAGLIIGAIIGQKHGASVSALLLSEDFSSMYGAMGAIIGLMAGEFIALLAYMFMTLIYQRSFLHLMKQDTAKRTEYLSDVNSKLISGIIYDGLQNFLFQLPILLFIILFRRYGIKHEDINCNALIGAFYSKYLPVIGLIASFAVFVVQSGVNGVISAANEGEESYASDRFTKLVGRVLYFVIPAFVFVTMLVPVIMKALFTGMTTTVSQTLSTGAFTIVVYSLLVVFVSLLIRLNYHKEILFLSAVSLIITTVLGFIFISKQAKGITGIAVLMMLYYGIILLASIVVLARNMRFKIRLIQQIVIPLIVSAVIGILIRLLGNALLEPLGGVLTLFICIIPGWLLYNIGCIFLRAVPASQMERKIFGNIFVYIGQNLGVY